MWEIQLKETELRAQESSSSKVKQWLQGSDECICLVVVANSILVFVNFHYLFHVINQHFCCQCSVGPILFSVSTSFKKNQDPHLRTNGAAENPITLL